MTVDKEIARASEPVHMQHAHLLCWRSLFAGLLISFMGYLVLAALGAGIAGSTAQNMIANNSDNAGFLFSGAGLYLGLSAVIALFSGTYFAVRIAQPVTNKLGAAHGFVIASAFFIIMVAQAASGIGAISNGLTQLIGGMAQGAGDITANPMVQDTFNKALGNSQLKSEPKVVVQGLATRLAQGDPESAKAYLAYQTNMTPAEVDARYTQLKADFDRNVKEAGQKAAVALADTGWALFVTFLVGLIAAVTGGRVAAHANLSRPLATDVISYRPPVLATQRGSALPYLVAWLFGVPTSILLMIFVLRAVF